MGGFERARRLYGLAQSYMKNVPLEEESQETFSDFSGGYVSAVSREQTPKNASPSCLDMEITFRNRIRPAPGTSTVENLAHAVKRLAVHASLDMTAELLLFAPPFVGVRSTGATVWTDEGIGDVDLAFVNFGGTFIFSDGNKVYKREPRAGAIEATDKIPVGSVYASFAGRFWAANCVIDGDVQPMGVSWSDTTSDPEGWDPDQGSGFELLINDLAAGDEVVSMRPMGLDFMAIMCRKSLWVARRTGLEDRPADLQPRVSGTGALNEKLTVLSRFGVFFLTHMGVHLFDGNSAPVVSDQINAEILPIDLDNLDKYGLFFNPLKRQLWLFTPTGSWMYEVEKARWLPRTMRASDGAMFAQQFTPLTWADLQGTWGDQTARWKDFTPEEGQQTSTLFLSVDGLYLHQEDSASRTAFGTAMNPYWDTPLIQPDMLDRLLTTHGVTIEYVGQGGVNVSLPDILSGWKSVLKLTLPSRSVPDTYTKGLTSTGRGVGARLVVRSGSPEILKIQLVYRKRGRRVDKI